MNAKTHKRLEELRVLLNFDYDEFFAMFSNGYKQAEQDMAKYKSACDVMMKALEYEIEQCEPSPKLDDITAAIAEANKILKGEDSCS